jgi:hypothetical protein
MQPTPKIVSVTFDDGTAVSTDHDGRYLIAFAEAADVDDTLLEAASCALKLFVRATSLTGQDAVATITRIVPPVVEDDNGTPPGKRGPYRTKAKKTAGASIECNICHRLVKTERGLAIHKGRDHKHDDTPPLPAGDDDDRLLRCGTDDCLFAVKTTEVAKLRSHVAAEHQRTFIAGETVPRTTTEMLGGGSPLMDDLDQWRDKSKFTG